MPELADGGGIDRFRASDGRVLAILVRADTGTEPPPRGQLTPDAWPIQLFLLAGDPGHAVAPHFHPFVGQPSSAARHQIFYCRRGRMRVGIFELQGTHVVDVTIGAGDLLLLAEGHGVRYLETGTSVVEIKQGPFPGSDAVDRAAIDPRR